MFHRLCFTNFNCFVRELGGLSGIDTYVTLENQRCCVTLMAVENILIRICAGISIHCMATRNLTVSLARKDCEVPFDILLACLDKRQGSRVSNKT